jgi:hypothetical protein
MNITLLTFNYAATALAALFCFKKRSFKLLDPAWAFLGGYFINYCVRPTLFLIDHNLGSAYAGLYDDVVILHGVSGSLIFALVGLAGFAIGNLAFERTAQTLARRLPAAGVQDESYGRLICWISFFFLVAGCAGLYGFISEVGWIGTLVELLQGGQRDAFMQVILGHGQYMFAMQLSLIGWAMICAHWFATPLPDSTSERIFRRIVQLGWFVVTLGIWVAFGERSSILAVVFIPIALNQTMKKRSAPSDRRGNVKNGSRAAALVLAGLFFLVAGPIGVLVKGVEMSPAAAVSMSISAWDSFEFTVIAQNQVRTHDLFFGKTYWQDLVYTWLPRVVFPWKPERYGSVLVQDLVAPELMANEGATFPPGILVEAFCNFGYIGLFLIPLFIGIICRALYNHLQNADWLWLILLAISFYNLASFRGFGGFVALLIANGAVLYFVMVISRALRTMLSSIGDLQPQSIS